METQAKNMKYNKEYLGRLVVLSVDDRGKYSIACKLCGKTKPDLYRGDASSWIGHWKNNHEFELSVLKQIYNIEE